MRNDVNIKPTGYCLWQVWAHREQIDLSRMFFVEEILTPSELSERGLQMSAKSGGREAALLAAGKGRKAKL